MEYAEYTTPAALLLAVLSMLIRDWKPRRYTDPDLEQDRKRLRANNRMLWAMTRETHPEVAERID